MLDPSREDEDPYSQFSAGSAITPGSIVGDSKEMAPPNAKVKVVNNRNKH